MHSSERGRPPSGAAPFDHLIGRVVDDRFEIITLLGSGGTSVVFEALDRHTGSPVALKVLHGLDDAGQTLRARRFAREAEVIAALDHPNALPLFAYGLIDGRTPYLATERIDGETLEAHLARGPLAPLTVVRIMDQVCDVLATAHRQGIVHRDLKPSNITVEPIDGRGGDWVLVRVLDFGLASWRTRGRLTMKGALMGSPRYMAPEQALDRPVSGRTDLYSLGVIAYECLTGRPPFEAPTPMAEMVKHVSEQPAPVDERAAMPPGPALAALVMGLLAKRPGDRPLSAEQVRAELADIERELDPDLHDGERDTLSMASVQVMARIQARRSVG